MAASNSQSSARAQTNGVLPVTASQTSGNPPKTATTKAPTPKLKVIIRRLPPGLTEAEFTSVLGEDWKLGQGKVDWFLYKPGKDSKDPSKPSRPSRAYLHLTGEPYLLELSDFVRQAIFEDAQNTYTSSCLIGPPAVEFAPYGRTPGGRRRVDARSGTIDQDPEFMAFLEGLANPITIKDINAENVGEGSSKQEKVTTTPLVQYLKDKKANKSKEAAAKAAKALAKGKSKDSSATSDDKKRGKDSKLDRQVHRAAKEAVKILNREAGTKTATTTATGSETAAAPKLDLGNVPGRQRGPAIAAHIRMLQRDLGLSPAQAHRQVRRDTADAQKAERAATAEKAVNDSKGASSSPKTPTQPASTAAKSTPVQSGSRRTRGKGPAAENGTSQATPTTPKSSQPVALLKKPESSQPAPSAPAAQTTPKAAPAAAARKTAPAAVPSDGATQAFVKHANPSQGVTESLLKEAMEKFGKVSMVEIDKRKGFAYVDFVDSDGLKKAMAANPVPVAQGTVQVMQRKGAATAPEKKPAPTTPHAPRGGRGGRGGTVGRRGGRAGGRGGASSGSTEASKAPPAAPTGPTAK